jgi:hypothetical protein
VDPKQNLEDQRTIRERILVLSDQRKTTTTERREIRDLAVRLAFLSEALDEWMEKGGALPEQWLRCRNMLGVC